MKVPPARTCMSQPLRITCNNTFISIPKGATLKAGKKWTDVSITGFSVIDHLCSIPSHLHRRASLSSLQATAISNDVICTAGHLFPHCKPLPYRMMSSAPQGISFLTASHIQNVSIVGKSGGGGGTIDGSGEQWWTGACVRAHGVCENACV